MRAVAIVCALVALPVLAFLGRLIWRVRHLAIVFALLAGAAHARPLGLAGSGVALDPQGPGWQARQPAPVEDPGRTTEVNSQPVVPAPVPVAAAVNSNPPPVALNPLAPLVPPACVPVGKPFPVWLTVTLAIVGAAVSTLEALHSTGVVGR